MLQLLQTSVVMNHESLIFIYFILSKNTLQTLSANQALAVCLSTEVEHMVGTASSCHSNTVFPPARWKMGSDDTGTPKWAYLASNVSVFIWYPLLPNVTHCCCHIREKPAVASASCCSQWVNKWLVDIFGWLAFMWWLQSFPLALCSWFPVRGPDGSPASPVCLHYWLFFFTLRWFILHWFEWVWDVHYEKVINDLC